MESAWRKCGIVYTAATLTARVAAGALLTALEIVPPPRLIERGADAGVAFFATVVTAKHYVLDAPLGALVVWFGWLIELWRQRHRAARRRPAPAHP